MRTGQSRHAVVGVQCAVRGCAVPTLTQPCFHERTTQPAQYATDFSTALNCDMAGYFKPLQCRGTGLLVTCRCVSRDGGTTGGGEGLTLVDAIEACCKHPAPTSASLLNGKEHFMQGDHVYDIYLCASRVSSKSFEAIV